MSGRGENKKSGTRGRGASNQSNQAMIQQEEKKGKLGHNKKQGDKKNTRQVKKKEGGLGSEAGYLG